MREAAERRATDRIAARSDHQASQGDADSAAGFDVPQLLIRDDLRTHVWLPPRLRGRGLGDRAAAQPAPRSPSCKPTNMSAWSVHRSEAALCNDIRRIDTMHAVFS
ncbi:hypothetical protein [Burkholderia ambifaria]|uniref:hypothetical protein n=1 Tax=Burkholderia ambifaria TaxID=152480 RepID=UPI0015892798|nr:hypothetical protein [Burkholderia ambifaria]MBR8347366.1 hypothetical protein [Burkholderia ambifaria]